jgi:hypothetical protein
MPAPEYKDRDLAPGAVVGLNHGTNDRVIDQYNKQAWIKVSEMLPDNAFADDVICNDDKPFIRGFSYA